MGYKNVSDKNLSDKLELNQRPENYSGVIVPRVNSEIWSNLDKFYKRRDLRTSNVQKNLAKAGSSLIYTTNKLLHSRQNGNQVDSTEFIKSNMEIMAILGHALVDLSHHRREAIKPNLNKEFAALCSEQVPPVTANLFGDDLQIECNNIKTTNKLRQSALANKGRDNFDRRRPAMQPSLQRVSAEAFFIQKETMAEQQAMVSQIILTKATPVRSRAERNGPNSIVMVSFHKQYVATLIKDLHQKVNCFEAVRISQCIGEWRKITSDQEILDMANGYTIELIEGPPPHNNQSKYEFSSFEKRLLSLKYLSLLLKA
ncbi:Hypothetical predicted protein [Paramuricea clavata]|uniref:Uncharacterized protein n=1 Tax=Paramuricea clavata TaxID=317549 RepID=A0A6S7ITJ7_PARCT|nr:Hypothetical predicted protein [Paramuricea clavata]